jgi:hypothetical protein
MEGESSGNLGVSISVWGPEWHPSRAAAVFTSQSEAPGRAAAMFTGQLEPWLPYIYRIVSYSFLGNIFTSLNLIVN